ncbi:MAG: NAD(P)H-dependent oxidoreductase [Verrucomicrobiales bacterium]
MSLFSAAGLIEQLKWRYATKKFDSQRTIPRELWQALEQVLVLTPSSFGLQPWRFMVVTDPSVKTALSAASWKQPQPIDCSHLVVFARRENLSETDVDRFLNHVAAVRALPQSSLARYREVIVAFRQRAETEGWLNTWADRQVYIALGNFMTAAAVLGVDTCPMEGIEPEKFDQILDLRRAGYATVVACAAGYRSADDKSAAIPKVRFDPPDVIHHV